MKTHTYQTLSFGTERQPIIVIDDFSSDPDGLLDQAHRATYGPGGHHYPGDRAPAPAHYLQERGAALSEIITQVFGMLGGADLIECNFSVVTTRPEALTPIQRFPHFDGTAPNRLALLHYLCPAEAGGTSFYRHRATGYETITDDRISAYDTALRAEVAEYGMPPAEYFHDSQHQFERIGQVPAAYNRMVVYRGITLHSGDILQPERVGTGLGTARITVNTFLGGRLAASHQHSG
ncbi:MAG: DUF6445 family protein [Pseudomonadota bacterium]